MKKCNDEHKTDPKMSSENAVKSMISVGVMASILRMKFWKHISWKVSEQVKAAAKY